MDYGSKASEIERTATNVYVKLKGASSSNFNGFWTGSAHDNLTSNLDSAIKNLTNQIAKANSFLGALKTLQKYKEAKERIQAINSELSGLDTVKDASRISSLENERSNKEREMEDAKSSVLSVISGISPCGTKFSVISA